MATNTQHSAGRAVQKEEKPAAQWLVLFINDDYTPFDWVELILMRIFGHTAEGAHQVALQVHTMGAGVAGRFDTREDAVERAELTMALSRQAGYPLSTKVLEAVSGTST